MQTKSSLALLVTAAVLIELTSAVQYWYAKKGIREQVEQRAKSELKVKGLEIQNILTAVEVAMKNHAWEAEQMLALPDSMYSVTRRLAEQNDQIVGAGISFVPNFYPKMGRWFEPYVKAEKGKAAVMSQLGSETHDYTQMDFYTMTMKSGEPYWSEPYLDSDGAHAMVTTYAYPLRDKTGKVVAIMGADVSLDWLEKLINASHIYPSSYNMMISRTGQLMVCPVESLVMRQNIQEATVWSARPLTEAESQQIADAIGRKWQLGTIQVDYNLPERFDLEFTDADGSKQRPVMIHRAPFGSLERFTAVVLEHTAGHLPVWLSPDQVKVLPISEKYADYAEKVCSLLKNSDIRASIDSRNETLGKRIREISLLRVPLIAIVGEKEASEGTVSVRREGVDQGSMTMEQFVQYINSAVAEELA